MGIQCQCARQFVQIVQRDIDPRTLDLTDESPVKLCGKPQLLLRQAARQPADAQVVSQHIAQGGQGTWNQRAFQVGRHANIVNMKQAIFYGFYITFCDFPSSRRDVNPV